MRQQMSSTHPKTLEMTREMSQMTLQLDKFRPPRATNVLGSCAEEEKQKYGEKNSKLTACVHI